jgi:CARDB
MFCALVLAGCMIVAAPAPALARLPRAKLRSLICQTAMDPAARAISVTAVMRPLSGTAKMAMRFQLLRRRPLGARAVSLSGHELNSWITPMDPTLGQRGGDVWVVRHPVVDLLAPDRYRFRVTFRWFGADGKVLGRAVRVSHNCAQPELRPDLTVLGVTVVPLAGGVDRYRVVVRNIGKTAAQAFDVRLAIGAPPDQQVPADQPVLQLAPRTNAAVHFRAPACTAGEPLTVSADPSGAVDDANRANNTLASTCPSGS